MKVLKMVLLIFALFGEFALAAPYEVDPNQSIFAIVTHKAGFAAQFAHNHMVFAERYNISIDADEKHLDEARFEFEAPVSDLINDLDPVSQKWFDRFKDVGIISEPFVVVSESDRSSIRQSMLGETQLDLTHYPLIKGSISSISREVTVVGNSTFTHKVKVKLNIHGHEVERWIPAIINFGDGGLQVEATTKLRFTDFDIKPFSAFFGAFRNQDEFDLYANFRAKVSAT